MDKAAEKLQSVGISSSGDGGGASAAAASGASLFSWLGFFKFSICLFRDELCQGSGCSD